MELLNFLPSESFGSAVNTYLPCSPLRWWCFSPMSLIPEILTERKSPCSSLYIQAFLLFSCFESQAIRWYKPIFFLLQSSSHYLWPPPFYHLLSTTFLPPGFPKDFGTWVLAISILLLLHFLSYMSISVSFKLLGVSVSCLLFLQWSLFPIYISLWSIPNSYTVNLLLSVITIAL